MKKLIAVISIFVISCLCIDVFGVSLSFSMNQKKLDNGQTAVDVNKNGKLMCQFRYGENLPKPMIWPLKTPSGVVVTRGYPIEAVKGESEDHPHHTGVFFSYDDVNGVGFWNNTALSPQIGYVRVKSMTSNPDKGVIVSEAYWCDKDKKKLLKESREMAIYAGSTINRIDFTITLTALDETVVFGDTKEGMFGVRVAGWLREKGGTGHYESSTGDKGAGKIWGRRASWVKLDGEKDGEKAGVAILNHPRSVNFPTYWHARDYGLFAANPLGQSVFEKSTGVESTGAYNYTLKPGESGVFMFSVLAYDGELSAKQVKEVYEAYCLENSKGVTAEGAELKKLADGFSFTEGPAVDEKGNVYFTDQPNDRILKYDIEGNLSTYMDGCERSNGLYFDRDGRLLACADLDNKLVAIADGTIVDVLAKGFKDKRFNGPNDLWVNPKTGGIFFTDPFYRRPYWKHDTMEMDGQCVYYLSPDRKTLTRVADGLKQPNGIIGTPDGKKLYVADIGDKKTYSYSIGEDGKLSGRSLFVREGSDGMTIDNEGNVYLTGDGVKVYDASGRAIEHIEIEGGWTANVCFGGADNQTLYITSTKVLYGIEMRTKGVQPVVGSDGVTAKGSQVEVLADSFEFTEGPAVDDEGNIYFTDIPNNKILKWSVDGNLSTYIENSGGANGLFFNRDGDELYVCAGGDREMAAYNSKKVKTVLLSRYQGKKLNSPNDLWPDYKGGIYFTDPRYGGRDGMELTEQVYYINPEGAAIRVTNDLVRPNGIIGTTDGKTLYIADAGDNKTYRYQINNDGTLSKKMLFASMGSDGMTVDNEGNVYLTGDGVTVFNPAGDKIDHIKVDHGWTANVCFGGIERNELFITASKTLCRIKMRVKGVE